MVFSKLVLRALLAFYFIGLCLGNTVLLQSTGNATLQRSFENPHSDALPASEQQSSQNLSESKVREKHLRSALTDADGKASEASAPYPDDAGSSGDDQSVLDPGAHAEVIDYIENYGVSHPEFYSLLTLSKCHCAGRRQVWTGSSCVEHKEDTIVAVQEDDFSPQVAANPMWYRSVEVHPVNCAAGLVKKVFRAEEFNLVMGTELLHSFSRVIFPEGSFCIEHIFDKKGELSWEAEACVPPPNVPVCCPEGQRLFEKTRVCVDTEEVSFHPPIYAENTIFPFINTTYNEINCSTDEEHLWIKLGGKDSSLIYSVTGVSFSWTGSGTMPVVRIPSDYCVVAEDKHSQTYWASFCYKDRYKEHQEKCANATCVRKCCDQGSVHDESDYGCIDPDEDFVLWHPTFHHLNSEGLQVQEDRPDDYVPIYGQPVNCQFFVLDPGMKSHDKFYLLANGSLHVPVWEEPIPSTSYCIDNFMTDAENYVEKAMVCFPETVQPKTNCQVVSNVLKPSLLLVSCVFLAITLAVYAIVPELHAKVHGKSLLSHVSSLLVAYLSLVVVQWGSSILPMPWCIAMASVVHMSFLASFFWLNVMCFDIYWTLRSLRPIPESGEGSRSRFKWYSAYAWGCPLIIGLVTIGMQQIDDNKHPELILPGFGVKNCWFYEQSALWLYFYDFVLLLTVINIIFFLQVAYILIQAQRVNKTILRNTRQDKDRMKLYVKLFVVMGVTWICEVISFQEGTCEVWMVTDIVNSLQGVFIFVIFVCKRTVFQKLRGKCDPGISRVKRIVRSTSSYATTSMSQRTTQISLDSIRGSSVNQYPKSPNSSSVNNSTGDGNMQVIHETAVDSHSSEALNKKPQIGHQQNAFNLNGSPVMVGDVVSARGGGSTEPSYMSEASARGGGVVSHVDHGTVSARGGLREEVTYELQNDSFGNDGPQNSKPLTVDVTIHG